MITKDDEEELLHISAVMPQQSNSSQNWSADKVEPYRTDLKSWWLFLRQVFVSEIYTKTRGSLKIKYRELKSLHESVMAHRKMLDGTSNQLVLWLLSELSEVNVSPTLLTVSEVVELKNIKRIMSAEILLPTDRITSISEMSFNAILGYLVLLDRQVSDYVKHQFQSKSWPETFDFEQYLLTEMRLIHHQDILRLFFTKLEILENGEFVALEEVPAEVEKWTGRDFLARCRNLIYFATKHKLEEKKLKDHELIVKENQRESTKESKKEEGNNLSNASRHIDEL